MWDGDGTQGPGVSQGGLDDDLFTTNKQYYYHKKNTYGLALGVLLDRTPVPNIHAAAVGLVDRRYCGSDFVIITSSLLPPIAQDIRAACKVERCDGLLQLCCAKRASVVA